MSDFNPDAFLAQAGEPQAAAAPPQADSFNPDAFLQSAKEDQYGGAGQTVKAALEGAGRGLLGPLAPAIEKETFHVKPEDILGREEQHPIAHGLGEASTLIGGALLGTGEAEVLSKAGEAATAMSGLANADKVGLGFKVGASAVKNAAEMAVLQGSDEVSKMILQDPNTSAETAISNIGLSAALGAGAGAIGTGVISPLWEATAGPKVKALFEGLKSHLNGNTDVLPEALASAQKALGVDIPVELKAAMSGNPTAVNNFNILKETGNKGINDAIDKFHQDLSEHIARTLKIAPEDVASYSESDAGHDLYNTFKKEYEAKYGPIASSYDKDTAEAANIAVSDDARLSSYGRLLEKGMEKVGTDSPLFGIYSKWGDRLLANETIGKLDRLKTEIGGDIGVALKANDTNTLGVLRDIRTHIGDLQEREIALQAGKLEKSGAKGASKLGAELLNERADLRRQYAEFAKMSNDLTDHLGVNSFTGAKGLINRLADKVSPEQLLNKFSIKGNADFIPFLKQHFPEVYTKVQENELKRFIKPSVLTAKGENPINISKLNSLIDKGMAGEKNFVQAIIPQEALDAVQHANTLSSAIPNLKSSGTAGHMTRVFKDMPRSAMAMVAGLLGHNPFVGAILGETAQRLGRDMPDAIRLAHLRFAGSDQPVKAGAIKSMVDFMHATYKGDNALAKSTKAVLQRGSQVVATNLIPDAHDREKLDKLVAKSETNPNLLPDAQQGHLGHYMPDHQQAVATTSVRAMQYLQSIKPRPHTFGPLDKPVPPTPIEVSRYNRALDIAQNPAIVLHHVKEGTLQVSDIADLNAMYPGLRQKMVQQLSNQMTNHHADEEPIPYRTRIGMAMFLGTPIDKSMEPASIQAAQPEPRQNPPQQNGGKNRKGSNSLGKSNKMYQTPGQNAEMDRSTRD